jgi:hypothetical protein
MPLLTEARPTSQARRSISKTRHMWFRQCALRSWFGEHDPLPQTPAPPGSIVGMGIEAGILARSLVPDGVLIDCDFKDYQRVLNWTADLMATPDVPAIFEAGFAHSRCLIRADILARRDGGWVLGEVKSSTKVKDEHLIEIALQVYVLQQCGVDLADVQLILINPEYVRGEDGLDVFGLFKRVSVSDAVRRMLPEVPAQIAANLTVLAQTTAPEIRPSKGRCMKPYPCDRVGTCWSKLPPDWIGHFLGRSPATFAQLDAAGVVSARDISRWDLFRLSPGQRSQILAARTGQIWRSPELPTIMAALKPPISALDFETCNPVIPLYSGTRPYGQVPFQWSHHHDDGSRLIHNEFLAVGNADPRREFAETLLATIEAHPGPILVYSPFEKTALNGLAKAFPELFDRIEALLGRLVDLLPVMRQNIIHPAFRGSYSLKKVAPAVAGITYDDLDIGEGGDASAVFYRLATDFSLSGDDRGRYRSALLEYCSRDTLALMHVHRWLS